MKFIKKNILKLMMLSSLVFTSCNENDFLDEVNPNSITSATFWQSEKQFNSALTTAYAALQFQAISGAGLQFEMAMSDLGGAETWQQTYVYTILGQNDATPYVREKWNESYVGIFRANQVIDNINNNIDSDIFVNSSKEEIEAQARFLRAFFYFQLVTTYNQAVISKIPENQSEFNRPLSTADEVTNSIIIPDLEFAIDNLPQEWPSSDLGRATWGAATALLAKSYLYNEEWTNAANLFKQVIDSDIYSLTEDPMDNFSHLTEFNSESIFEVPYSEDIAPGIPGNAVDDNSFESGAEASAITHAFAHLSVGGFNEIMPTYYLHEMFTADEVDESNPINDGNMQSKRMSVSIIPRNGEGMLYGLPVSERQGMWPFGQSSYVKKYTNWYHKESEDGQNRSGINYKHIRLADVYLMYAEAVLNSTGDYETAINYIDMVRSRAGVKTLEQYMEENTGAFPQFHVSEQVNGSRPLVQASAATVLTHIQRVERPLELCFEGFRYRDLVRWGIAREVFEDLRQEEIWRENNLDALNLNGGGIAPMFIVERIRPDFNLLLANYSSVLDYFPIPTDETQTNDQLNN